VGRHRNPSKKRERASVYCPAGPRRRHPRARLRNTDERGASPWISVELESLVVALTKPVFVRGPV